MLEAEVAKTYIQNVRSFNALLTFIHCNRNGTVHSCTYKKIAQKLMVSLTLAARKFPLSHTYIIP